MRFVLCSLLLVLRLPLTLRAQEAGQPRLFFAGLKGSLSQPGQPAAAATPARNNEASAPEHCAKVELKSGEWRPLEVDTRVWSDRDVHITKFPAKFQGFQFTQMPAHGLTLTFKVTEAGTVILGCSSRWGTTAEPDVAKDFTTAKKLLEQGWVRHPRDEIETSSYDMQFLFFTRECKAGDEFTFRTDKFAPPILVTK